MQALSRLIARTPRGARAWIILINIVVDVAYAFIDPRVGFGSAVS